MYTENKPADKSLPEILRLMEKKYSHIIFDIDGTLVDTAHTSVLSFQKTLKDLLGLDLSYEETYPYFGIPSTRVLEMFPFKDRKHALEIWEENFRALFGLIKPFDGVVGMLASISESGYHTGVVTSRSVSEFEYDHNLHAMLPYFRVKVCAEDTVLHKPHPEPLLKYMEYCGAAAEKCLYVGDTDYDYLCADGAGVDFALAQWGFPASLTSGVSPRIHLRAHEGAKFVLPDIAALEALLLS